MNTNRYGDPVPYYYPDDGTALRDDGAYYVYIEPTCHGCEGKGWVSPTYGVAAICPVCKGSGKPAPITSETSWDPEWEAQYPPPHFVRPREITWDTAPSTFEPYGRHDYEEVLC